MKNAKQKLTYADVGDNYDTKDPIKKLAQDAAAQSGKNLAKHGFSEISDTRGESAYAWQQGSTLMATVIEGLGTKNIVADGMREITGKTYYDVIAHDTVATIVNDLTTVGAQPLTVHAYWAIEDNSWLADAKRMQDLIAGWKSACDIAGASWGGGETPTMKGIIVPGTCELGGSAVGIIKNNKHLITDTKLAPGDQIVLLKSNGINANGLSLARAIAKKLPKGYGTKLSDGTLYGNALLTKTNIYASLIQALIDNGISLHYIVNITGHGLRKIMRARQNYTYIVEKLFNPQEVFLFMQKHAGISDEEAYGTWNMGQDYALFLPERDIAEALRIIKRHKFHGLHAGYVEKGEKQLFIQPKKLTFKGVTLDLR
ncbi:MAG: phosphoribosylformylglycinamidine cyclo-ligase [Candidatus Levybacteria bacterium]|nr:phosphoribosylformylglycinamidine cyclo-ligase [Candidatus Levybacteria bacterium]